MAFTSTKNLYSDPFVNLKDYHHAANLFNVDQMRLAPKHGFLFHVSFSINVAALKNTALVQRYGNEINMLVKSIDLPSFTIDTVLLNQYNRKKVMQTSHKASDIKIKFHDDNMGLINQLWQNYYSYYYADSTSAKTAGAYNRNATRSSDFILTPYGLDNNSTAPFFNSIKIYQMARHEWVSYQLFNPLINSWTAGSVAYSDTSKTREFDMSIKYEAVAYDHGEVVNGNPEGFAMEHYDLTPSPLGGINPDPTVYDPSFVQALDLQAAAPGILNNTINSISLYERTKERGQTRQTSVLLPQLTTAASPQVANTTNGVIIPQSSTVTSANTTTASQSKIV